MNEIRKKERGGKIYSIKRNVQTAPISCGDPPGDLRSKISRKFWRLGILAGRRPRRKRPAPLAKRREAHSPRPKISRKFWGLGSVFTRLLNFREILEIRFQNFREILETKISGNFGNGYKKIYYLITTFIIAHDPKFPGNFGAWAPLYSAPKFPGNFGNQFPKFPRNFGAE